MTKIPLSAACIETDYDITREQPQLFVARDFEHLHEVLDRVAAGLAQRIGGEYALAMARASGEVATVELDSGVQLTGRLVGVDRDGDGVALLRWAGRVGLGSGDQLFAGRGTDAGAERESDVEPVTPLGPLADGRSASQWLAANLASLGAPGGELELRFRSGIVVRGTLRGHHAHADGRLAALQVDSARVSWGDRTLFRAAPNTSTHFALGEEVATAFAGAADSAYWPAQGPTFRVVPAPRAPRPAIAMLDRAPSWPPSSGAFSAGRL